MIVLDTSALMAVLQDEPLSEACMAVLEREERLLMSTVTFAEASIVAARRGLAEEMARLIEGLGVEFIDVTAAVAGLAVGTYARYGKGAHSAALNFGDCFAYATASLRGCPLLFVGNDFAQTDVQSAL